MASAAPPPPNLPQKPEVSTPPPSATFSPDSTRRPAVRPMAPSSRFDPRDRDRDWERDRGRGYPPPPLRSDVRRSPSRREHGEYARPPYPRDRDLDRGRRDSSRDGGSYERRPAYPRPHSYYDSRGRFPPSRPYRSPPPRRRTRSPRQRRSSRSPPYRRGSRSPPPRRRYSPSPPSRRPSRSPGRPGLRKSRSRSPVRNRSPITRRRSRSRSRSRPLEKSRLPSRNCPPMGTPTSPRSHREQKWALQKPSQSHLPSQLHQSPPSYPDIPQLPLVTKEAEAKPTTAQVEGDAAVPIEVVPRDEADPLTQSVCEPTLDLKTSRTPTPSSQRPLTLNQANVELPPLERTPTQSVIMEDGVGLAAAPPSSLKPEARLTVSLPNEEDASPISHRNKASPYSPRPPFKQEERPQDHLKPVLTPQTIAHEMSVSTSASHSPGHPFHAHQPERTLSSDAPPVLRSAIGRLGGARTDGHEPVPRFARIVDIGKRDTVYAEKDMFGLTLAWQQRLHLEKEDWALSRQMYNEMQELELTMMDLGAAQARKKIAECMLDKAKAGVLGIDALPPYEGAALDVEMP